MTKDSKDPMGDRMKDYESRETARRFLPMLPVYARIDGRGFSKFTKGMARPYDQRMTDAMVEVTNYLVKETHAQIGYVQSDEISLVWMAEDYDSSVFFDGKIAKMTSVLASMAAAKMAQAVRGWAPFEDRLPAFDARVIQLPNKVEAANMVLWRTMDAVKNAVSMACHHHHGHKQMHKLGRKQMIELMKDNGVNYDEYPEQFRLGTFAQRQVVEKVLTDAERMAIAEKHRPKADEVVTRTVIRNWSLPFRDVEDRVGFIFGTPSK